MAFSLRQYREEQLFLKRRQVAKLSHASHSLVQRIEMDHKACVYWRIPSMAAAYRLPIDFFREYVTKGPENLTQPPNAPLAVPEPLPQDYAVSK